VFAPPCPERYGGLSGSVIGPAIVAEVIGRYSGDVVTPFGGAIFCSLNVAYNGSEEQKQYWLPKPIAGKIRMPVSTSGRMPDPASAPCAPTRDAMATTMSSTARKSGLLAPAQKQRHQSARLASPGISLFCDDERRRRRYQCLTATTQHSGGRTTFAHYLAVVCP
jgi:hypothetical protein